MRQDLAFIGWVLIVTVLAAAGYLAAMAARRVVIRRPGGAVACSLRQDGDQRWRAGVAAYRTDQLCWFRSHGMGLRPDVSFDRRALALVARHDGGLADPVGPVGAVARTVVVRFETGGSPVWLAMSGDALTGMLAWLEAGPRSWLGSIC